MRMNDPEYNISERFKSQETRKRWQKIVAALAVLVAAVTFSLLVFPGIAMSEKTLACQVDVHQHTDACYDDEGNIICGYADFVVHTHNEYCYNDSGELICNLPEIKEHTHGEACYVLVPVLVCGTQESEGHTHTDSCYTISEPDTSKPVCGLEESAGHKHTEECYITEAVLVCPLEEDENHTHSEECYEKQKTLICTIQESEGHTHTEECYPEPEPVLVCGIPESKGHIHTEECNEYRQMLVCTQDEIIVHTHTADCYDAAGNIVCGLLEVKEHVHDESCKPYVNEEKNDSEAAVSSSGGSNVIEPILENAAETGTDFGKYITKITVEKEVNGQWQAGTEFVSGDSIRVTIDYSIAAGIVTQENKVITYQLPEGVGLRETATGPVESGNEIVGTYVIGTDGLITITFNDEFTDGGQAFAGNIQFQGMIAATGEEGDDEVIFGGSGESIIIVPNPEANDLSIQKAGSYDKDTNKVHYVLTVSSEKGSDGEVNISDKFAHTVDYGKVVYDEDSIVIYHVGPDGVQAQINGYTPVFDNNTGAGGFTISGLPELGAGEAYRIEYTAAPDLTTGGDINGYMQFTNNAVASDDTNRAEASANIRISNARISKEGSYNALTRKITWTININQDQWDIGGLELSDVLTYTAGGAAQNMELPQTVTLTAYDGGMQVGESIQIELPYTFPEGSNYHYVVTYETELPEGIEEGAAVVMHNTAKIGEYEASFDVNFNMPGELEYDVIKHALDEGNTDGTVSWSTVITYPDTEEPDASKLTYIDILADLIRADESLINDSHYITRSLLEGSLSVMTGDFNTPLEYGTDFSVYAVSLNDISVTQLEDYYNMLDVQGFEAVRDSLSWKPLDAFDDDGPLGAFCIVFNQEAMNKIAGKSLVVNYSTHVDMDNVGTDEAVTIANIAWIPDKYYISTIREEQNETLNKQASPVGFEAGGSDSYTDDNITVDLNESGGKLYYRLLLYTLGNESKTITVTDTLPAGVSLNEDSIVLYNYYEGDVYGVYREVINTDNYYLSHSAHKNDDGTTTVTFTLNYRAQDFEDEAILAIFYDVAIDDTSSWESGHRETYVNTAVSDGSEDSTSTEVEYYRPAIEKSGEQITDADGNVTDIVRYYVTVNPDARDLNPESDRIKLTDILTISDGTAASFMADTVSLYEFDANAENNCGALIDKSLYSADYDSANHTITFDLPDDTACVVVYEYSIDRGSVAGDVNISNRAVLSGEAEISDEDGLIIEEQESEATVNRATLRIYKHDSENVARLLSGAEFSMERYEEAGGVYEWVKTSITGTGTDGSFVVGESGYIELSFLEHHENGSLYNTLYRVAETKAPDGYVPDDIYYYFVWMEQGADEQQTIADMREAGAVPDGFDFETENVMFIAYSTNDSIYVPNNPTSLSVKKEWKDGSGNDISEIELAESGITEIEIKLYQWIDDGERTEYDNVKLSAENGWSHEWKALPMTDGQGNDYHYAVEEMAVTGFNMEFSENSGDIVFTDASISAEVIVTNTQSSGYVLPETGGSGTDMLSAAGLTLACTGLIGIAVSRRKRKDSRL
jgi:LPXTG-motif cell wall-anchored protein